MRFFRTYVLVVVLWLVCTAAVAGLTARGHAVERERLYERFQNRSDTGASFVGAYVSDIFATEQRLADRMAPDSWSPKDFEASIQFLGFPAGVLLDRRGRAVALAPDAPDMRGVQLAKPYPHLATALAGRPAVSDVVVSAVDKEPIVAFALPLTDNRFGVLSGGFSLGNGPLRTFLQRQPIAGSRGYVLDSKGVTIVAAGRGATDVPRTQLTDALREPTVTDGRLMAATPIPGTRWTYLLDAPIDAVMDPVAGNNRSQWGQLATLAALSLIGLVLARRATAARTQARLEKADADQRLRLTVQNAPIGMTTVALDHTFVEPNERLCRMLGYSADELVTMTFEQVTHADDVELDRDFVERLTAGKINSYELEKRYVRSDGTLLWGRLAVSVVRDDSGRPQYFVSQVEDVTEFRAAQSELVHRALHDPLTGLANRGLLMDRLEDTLDARSSKVDVGIGFCDVDHFKRINDTHGHHAGDEVLKEVACRLRSAVRTDDTVARMGGDEFVILLSDVASLNEAEQVIERAIQSVRQPITVGDETFLVGLSVGLAVGRPGTSPDALLGEADTALYAAKDGGRGRCVVYEPGLRTSPDQGAPGQSGVAHAVAVGRATPERQTRMELIIRDALDQDTIGLAYQPVFDLTTGALVGTEALLRLDDGAGRAVPPKHLIPAAESSGQIVDLGRRVLQTAALQAATWRRDHGMLLPIAVNVSAAQLGLAGFPQDVLAAVRGAGVPAHALMIELTESVLLQSGSTGMAQLRSLREAGIELAIDDFGTGYASLSLLHELPAATLKIDQSFVAGIPDDPRATAIVAGVIALAKNFDMSCIAEGIENESQRSYLAARGVLGQGFLLGIPDDAATIGQLIAAGAMVAGPVQHADDHVAHHVALPVVQPRDAGGSGGGPRPACAIDTTPAPALLPDTSSFDPVSGAYARGPGLTQLDREIARARRIPQSLVLALVRVDGLGSTNQDFGRAAGDRLLRAVADALKPGVRHYDLVIRYGSDQFVCAVPGRSVLEWQQRLALVKADIEARSAPASLHVGLAETRPDDTALTLIARADVAQRAAHVPT